MYRARLSGEGGYGDITRRTNGGSTSPRLCEHTFDVGNAGTPQGRLRRALASRDPLSAMTAAADCKHLVLDDALALAVLLLRADDRRGSRAAARAVARYALELPRVELDELALIVAGFGRLAHGDRSLELRLLLHRRGLPAAMEQLDRQGVIAPSGFGTSIPASTSSRPTRSSAAP
jgi:hypothetical protein